jgi:SDR family mycofactocin-dependent oxidoreductase
MGRLDGKVAFITGGARGQGRAIAYKFATEGADIVTLDVGSPDLETLSYPLASPEDMTETVELVEGVGREIVAEVGDVRSQDQIDAVVQKGLDRFGKIDILIVNAGIVDYKPFWEMTEPEWHDVVDVCMTGAWRTAKSLAPHMIERQQGVMVFTSSVNGIEAGWNYMSYIAAKHGVMGIMRSAALELGPHNIRVHAVLPGPIDTPINDNKKGRDRIVGHEDATREEYLSAIFKWNALRGRTALPAEAIADGMIWLVSDESRHASGVELIIDAGHMMLPGTNPNPIEDFSMMEPPNAVGAGAENA